jgi:hypothetical protein
MRTRTPWRSLSGLLLLAAPAAAQVQDGDAFSAYVPAGATAQLSHFNSCIVVTNNSGHDAQYGFSTAAEWATFTSHPNPDVTHSSCPSSPPASPPPPPTQASCQGPNGAVPSGQLFNTFTTTSEACSAAGFGPGATGTATAPVTNVNLCTNGQITLVSSSTGAFNTSQCKNSAGGSCVPFDVANPTNTCAEHNVSERDPLCEWTAAHNGNVQGARGQQVCWFAEEFAAHLSWSLSSDVCTCNPAVVVDNQVAALPVNTDCAPAPNSAPPSGPVNLTAGQCPNASATCIVQPQGACNDPVADIAHRFRQRRP